MRIGKKFGLLAIVIVLASSLAIGVIVYLQFDAMTAKLQEDSIVRDVRAEAERLTLAIGEMEHDIEWLAGYSNSLSFPHRSDGDEAQIEYATLRSMCLYLMEAKPSYDQVRLIGAPPAGQELLRINRKGTEVQIVSEENLQSKGHRDYFRNALEAGSPEIALSQIDLNVEHGKIEVPHKATIRAVGRLMESVHHTGFWVVVINMDFGRLMKQLDSHSRLNGDMYLLNSDGDYLMHPDASMTFGFDLGERHRLQDEFPDAGAFVNGSAEDFIFRSPSLSESGGDLLYLYRFFPFRSAPDRPLIIGIYAHYDQLVTDTWKIAIKSVIGVFLLILASSVVAWYLASRVTRPIEGLSEAVRLFGLGRESKKRLPLGLRDEIGDLARAFERMQVQICDREEINRELHDELNQAHAELAHFARLSSHELREPVKRIAALSELIAETALDGEQEDKQDLAAHLNEAVDSVLRQLNSFRRYVYVSEAQLELEPVDMADLVRDALRPFMADIMTRNVDVVIQDLPTLMVSRKLIADLFGDLLDNAMKYAEGEGFLLSIRVEERSETRWRFSVENSQSSIPQKDLSKALQPFYRLNRKTVGSGMGLAIAKQIVQRHGGRLWLKSGKKFVRVEFEIPS